MEYIIKDINDFKEDEIENNSTIYFELDNKFEGKGEKLLFSTLIYSLVIKKECQVKIEDIIIKKDFYFEKVVILEKNDELIKKIYRPSIRINEGTDNYLLPIGSLVKLVDESVLYIAGRALQNEFEEGRLMYTDYVGYFYPTGLESEEKYVFNHEKIVEILHLGYQDEIIDEISYSIMKTLNQKNYEKYEFDEEEEDIKNI